MQGVGELAHGVQSSLEGDAAQIDLVSEHGFLHDAANQIIGNSMHAQFALDHVGGHAAQHVHVEMDFDFAKMEFLLPAAEEF